MSQCVPSWDLHVDNPKLNLPHSNLDYEVAELTWENGQLSMHGLSPPRVPITSPVTSPRTKYTWDKPRATGGTLESIVNQATFSHHKVTAYSRYAGVDANAALNSAAVTATREAARREEAKKKAKAKSSISTKRVRAAAIHNQSERKRREKINQRMKTLQKLVPNSSKTDKASILDEVIEYLKQLQAQVYLAGTMNMSPIMLPLAMQQQLQMSMMVPMMGPPMMGMGLNIMDMNAMGSRRPTLTGMPPALHPMTAVISPLTPWEGTGGDWFHTPASVIPDPMSTFLATCRSRPMSIDAYSRIAMPLHQQLHQNPGPSINN